MCLLGLIVVLVDTVQPLNFQSRLAGGNEGCNEHVITPHRVHTPRCEQVKRARKDCLFETGVFVLTGADH